jgi:hypothetical protein
MLKDPTEGHTQCAMMRGVTVLALAAAVVGVMGG